MAVVVEPLDDPPLVEPPEQHADGGGHAAHMVIVAAPAERLRRLQQHGVAVRDGRGEQIGEPALDIGTGAEFCHDGRPQDRVQPLFQRWVGGMPRAAEPRFEIRHRGAQLRQLTLARGEQRIDLGLGRLAGFRGARAGRHGPAGRLGRRRRCLARRVLAPVVVLDRGPARRIIMLLQRSLIGFAQPLEALGIVLGIGDAQLFRIGAPDRVAVAAARNLEDLPDALHRKRSPSIRSSASWNSRRACSIARGSCASSTSWNCVIR